MEEVLRLALEGHGGFEAWSSWQRLAAKVTLGGVVLLGYENIDSSVEASFTADLPKESATLNLGGANGQKIRISQGRTYLLGSNGGQVTYRPLVKRNAASAITLAEAASICLSAMWNAVFLPFLFAGPGVEARETRLVMQTEAMLRRLEVRLPEQTGAQDCTHVAYFSPDGLLRRLDYASAIFRGPSVSQHFSEFFSVQGLQLAHAHSVVTRRHSKRWGAGVKLASIRFSSVHLS